MNAFKFALLVVLVAGFIKVTILESLQSYGLVAIVGLLNGIDWIRYRKLLATRLEAAGVLERLIGGDPEFHEIINRTPHLFREIFMRPPGKDLEANALLLAWNLDWYLHPRKIHFRWNWVALIILLVMSVAFLLMLFGAPTSMHSVSFGIGPALLMLLISDHYRKQLFTAALVRKLRTQYIDIVEDG